MPIQTITVKWHQFPIRTVFVNTGSQVPQGGGAFLSTNVARVDPSGDDSTGVVGDLNKPFLTIQAALTAFESASLTGATLFVNGDQDTYASEDLTTDLYRISFVGYIGAFDEGGTATYPGGIPVFNSLTLTNTDFEITIASNGCVLGDISCNTAHEAGMIIDCRITGAIRGDITNTGGGVQLLGPGNSGSQDETGGFTVTALTTILISGFLNPANSITLNADTIIAENCILTNAFATTNTSITDARSGSYGVLGTVTQTDIRLNPTLMDFSTLPTSEPSTVGRAWIDTMDSNAVKVKL